MNFGQRRDLGLFEDLDGHERRARGMSNQRVNDHGNRWCCTPQVKTRGRVKPVAQGGAVTNPGTGSQNLSSVVVTVANADGTAWGEATPGCSAADYTVDTPVVVYGAIAGGAAVDGTVVVAMNDLATNQDACQGVTVPLYFVAS